MNNTQLNANQLIQIVERIERLEAEAKLRNQGHNRTQNYQILTNKTYLLLFHRPHRRHTNHTGSRQVYQKIQQPTME